MGASSSPMGSAQSFPADYPPWAKDLGEQYYSGTTCLFVLHGNVHDLIRVPDGAKASYCNLAEFLATRVFGSWDIVLDYDLGRGLRALAGPDPARLQGMMQVLSVRLGDPGSWPRDPENVLLLLDRFIERNLLEEDDSRRKRIAVVLDYAQYLAPAGDLNTQTRGAGANLVRLLSWAQNPYIKRLNIAFCLISQKLSELNDRLVQSPHVSAVEIPLPDRAAREEFVQWFAGDSAGPASNTPPSPLLAGGVAEFTPSQLADVSSGLSLVNLNVVLSQARQTQKKLDAARFRQLKKTMIERQCQGLVEFVEPRHTLDLVVGSEAAKSRLREDAEMVTHGRLDAAPMGYLFCGAVGTGKSFLAECYAGSIGIPCVTLRNFRSKYVGETEGNIEQVLNVLRSLGPVVVIIDEADAALGNRQADGDSGTSSRVFSMIASQMGNTQYRGRIIWMLLTSRPDLLPIDLKRQGRAEVHIPLFYPQGEVEVRAMFLAMAKKNKVALAPEAVPAAPVNARLWSGADIESMLLAAKRRALAAGRGEPEKQDLEAAVADFIPSAQGLEKEVQELSAVMECTQMSFLPEDYRRQLSQPDGRVKVQRRIAEIRELLAER